MFCFFLFYFYLAQASAELAQIKKMQLQKKREKMEEVDKSYFVDIKTSNLPPSTYQLQQQPPITAAVTPANQQPNPSYFSSYVSSPTHRQPPPSIDQNLADLNLNNNDIDLSFKNAAAAAALPQAVISNHETTNDNTNNEVNLIEITLVVENGHDTFMRALNNRNRNLNSIRMICLGGNIKVRLKRWFIN